MLNNHSEEFLKLPLEKQQIISQAKLEFVHLLINRNSEKSNQLLQKFKALQDTDEVCWNLFFSKTTAMIESIHKQENHYKKLSQVKLKEIIIDAKNILHYILYKKEKFDTNLEIILWIIIFLSILLFYFYKNLKNTNLELRAFKTAVENSFNVVVITDENMNISYVNDLFEKVTGYSKQSVIGKNPRFLQSGLQDEEFYSNLNDTIKKGQKWKGQFINKDKEGNLFYEDATITPILDKYKTIKGYLSIKRNVTQNVKNEKLLEELNNNLQEEINKQVQEISQKEKQLLEQRKLVAMGEMLGNIAHQWRQPLAGISATLLNIESKLFTIQSSTDTIHNEKLKHFFEFIATKNDKIRNYVHHLSDTIDIFRDFIKEDKKYTKCILQDLIKETVSVIDSTLKSNYIKLINTSDSTEDITVTIIKGELSQVLLNILNNAKDAIKEQNPTSPWIKIDLLKKENSIIISIEDNAGGIPLNIQSKIFDPYFTTKHQSQGTGLGLNMSYKIITESLHGKLYTSNTPNGAKFFIELPLK